MTLAEIKDAVNAKLAPLWTLLQARQATYYAAHGRYAQFLRTHLLDPQDGAEAGCDRLQDRPHYQAERWGDILPELPATLPMSIRVDTYQGPAGDGFTATVRVTVQGVTYERAAQVGAETWRAFGWRVAGGEEVL